MFIGSFSPVLFDDADPAQPFNHLLCVFKRHVVHLRQFGDRVGNAGFFEIQEEFNLFFVQDKIQHPVFRIPVVEFFGQLFNVSIRNH